MATDVHYAVRTNSGSRNSLIACKGALSLSLSAYWHHEFAVRTRTILCTSIYSVITHYSLNAGSVYMNDDLFMLNPVTPATFYTSAYGIVLHLQPDLLVKPDRPSTKVLGEWRSLGESNWLLSASPLSPPPPRASSHREH